VAVAVAVEIIAAQAAAAEVTVEEVAAAEATAGEVAVAEVEDKTSILTFKTPTLRIAICYSSTG
jgi:hypothetical protein